VTSQAIPHGTVRICERQFFRAELVLDKEQALADSPPRNAPWELAQEGLLVEGQAEKLAGSFGG